MGNRNNLYNIHSADKQHRHLQDKLDIGMDVLHRHKYMTHYQKDKNANDDTQNDAQKHPLGLMQQKWKVLLLIYNCELSFI